MRMTRTVLVAVVAVLVTAAGTALAAVYHDFSEFRHIRHTGTTARTGGTDWLASADITKAELQASNFFTVNTLAGAVDLDFGNDAALDAADIGSEWRFVVTLGGTNALTVTAGASGVTSVATVVADGSTCEDVGDSILVIAYSTTQATVVTQCAD